MNLNELNVITSANFGYGFNVKCKTCVNTQWKYSLALANAVNIAVNIERAPVASCLRICTVEACQAMCATMVLERIEDKWMCKRIVTCMINVLHDVSCYD